MNANDPVSTEIPVLVGGACVGKVPIQGSGGDELGAGQTEGLLPMNVPEEASRYRELLTPAIEDLGCRWSHTQGSLLEALVVRGNVHKEKGVPVRWLTTGYIPEGTLRPCNLSIVQIPFVASRFRQGGNRVPKAHKETSRVLKRVVQRPEFVPVVGDRPSVVVAQHEVRWNPKVGKQRLEFTERLVPDQVAEDKHERNVSLSVDLVDRLTHLLNAALIRSLKVRIGNDGKCKG